jgi:hypothetical protein
MKGKFRRQLLEWQTSTEYKNRQTTVNFRCCYQLLKPGSTKWTDNAQKMKIISLIHYSMVINDATKTIEFMQSWMRCWFDQERWSGKDPKESNMVYRHYLAFSLRTEPEHQSGLLKCLPNKSPDTHLNSQLKYCP